MTNNKVLICDDSRSIRLMTKRLLQGNGYQVVGEASNGTEATEAFKTHNPDLVLLDLVMPETDGKTALRQIVQHNPSAKVVILSSLGSESDVEECLRSGASSYIQKPFEEDILLSTLSEL
ncbi:MAG: response regulator [Cellvibrionaceae bacterium]|nr:response regulator [Cellvibrionaceae bacterium]